MIKEFEEGETYSNKEFDEDIFVLAIGEETKKEFVLAILWVDRETKETTRGDELTVLKSGLKAWSKVKI